MSILIPEEMLDIRTLSSMLELDGACGCHQRTVKDGEIKWFVCDYHEGYDEACELHGKELPRWTQEELDRAKKDAVRLGKVLRMASPNENPTRPNS